MYGLLEINVIRKLLYVNVKYSINAPGLSNQLEKSVYHL